MEYYTDINLAGSYLHSKSTIPFIQLQPQTVQVIDQDVSYGVPKLDRWDDQQAFIHIQDIDTDMGYTQAIKDRLHQVQGVGCFYCSALDRPVSFDYDSDEFSRQISEH